MLERITQTPMTSDADQLFPLTVRNLSLTVDDRQLLQDLSFVLKAETKTAILGHNGAGKSLLLRILHGLLKPTAGNVLWNGREIDDQVRSKQALVFQRPVLLRRSSEANIHFVLGHLPTEERNARTEALLLQAGLLEHAKKPARRLSGGEQQRLAIVRALATNPSVLFLDEPCANLDPAATLAVESLIKSVHEAGTKIILVTHDLGQPRRLCDDIIFLHNGRLAEHSMAPEFFSQPKSTSAQAFLNGQIVL